MYFVVEGQTGSFGSHNEMQLEIGEHESCVRLPELNRPFCQRVDSRSLVQCVLLYRMLLVGCEGNVLEAKDDGSVDHLGSWETYSHNLFLFRMHFLIISKYITS